MKTKASRAPTSKLAFVGFGVLLLFGVLVSSATTQWLAMKFGHQPALGERGMLGLYHPAAWFGWLWRFYRSAPEIFGQAFISFALAMGGGVFAYAFYVGFGIRNIKKHDDVHGTAHWATPAEIRASGLLPEKGKAGEGVYCGAWRDGEKLHYLRHNGPEHIAAIAPTRSGKGVGLVVPSLLSWPGSVVVNDQKGELWAMTAGWRKAAAGNLVLKFDPAAASGSVAFNPLQEVRVGTEHEVADVQNLATIIVDPEGKGMVDHWQKTAHAFLTGLIIHLGYIARAEGRAATLPDVVAAISNPSRPIADLYTDMIENTHVDGSRHMTVAEAGRDMLNRADAERSGVLSTTMSFLSLYRDPLVAKNVSRSDFSISDLMNYVEEREEIDPATGEVTTVRTPRPVSLYLVVSAEDKDRMRPLMRLILNQIVRVLLRPELTYVDGRAQPPHLQRLLLMLDEFPSYGRLDVLQEALAYIAGYGIKAYLIMQDISQLQAAYGRDESITSNCHIRIAYAPNKPETARWLSDLAGVTTVITERITSSGSRFGAVLGQTSRTFSEGSRPLITPDEVSRLGAAIKDGQGNILKAGEVLVFVAGHAPIRGEQSLYFLNPVFTQRVRTAPPAESDSLKPPSGAPHRPLPPGPDRRRPRNFGAFMKAREGRVASAGAIPSAGGSTRRAQVLRALQAAHGAKTDGNGSELDPALIEASEDSDSDVQTAGAE